MTLSDVLLISPVIKIKGLQSAREECRKNCCIDVRRGKIQENYKLLRNRRSLVLLIHPQASGSSVERAAHGDVASL